MLLVGVSRVLFVEVLFSCEVSDDMFFVKLVKMEMVFCEVRILVMRILLFGVGLVVNGLIG